MPPNADDSKLGHMVIEIGVISMVEIWLPRQAKKASAHCDVWIVIGEGQAVLMVIVGVYCQ